MPTESEPLMTMAWNWRLFALYCLCCFILGLCVFAITLPGIVAVVAGAILGACASNWRWFEMRSGRAVLPARASNEPVWKVKIPGGQQGKARRRVVYDILEKHGVFYLPRSRAADAFHSGQDGEVPMYDLKRATAIVTALRALDISATVIEPKPPAERG
jgi:hypothetical protein